MPPIPELPKKPISSIPTSEIKISPLKIPSGVSKESAITGIRNETRVKMNRMRLRIAQRLKEAQNTYAMLTTFNEIDMSYVFIGIFKYFFLNYQVFLKIIFVAAFLMLLTVKIFYDRFLSGNAKKEKVTVGRRLVRTFFIMNFVCRGTKFRF